MLLVVAFGLAWILREPVLGTIEVRAVDAVLGVAASLPLLALFGWTLHSSWAPLVAIREFLETHARPFLGSWSLLQLAVISMVAGISEEVLFRGVLQAGLSHRLGPVVALVLASAAFGLCHCVNRAYAVLAGLLGAYLGGLLFYSGGLLAPIVTHTVYDFVALVWFLRLRPAKEDREQAG